MNNEKVCNLCNNTGVYKDTYEYHGNTVTEWQDCPKYETCPFHMLKRERYELDGSCLHTNPNHWG